MSVVLDNLNLFLDGLAMTAALTLLSFAVALVLGTLAAAFRVSPVPPLRAAGSFYIDTVRNTPLAVIFVLFFFGLTKVGVFFSPFVTAVIVLGMYEGTFVGEVIRSGINAVAQGQAEAARALGLTFSEVLGIVVLPQAFRTVVQPLGNVFIALIKNSSVALVIGVQELTFHTKRLGEISAQTIPVFAAGAVLYLLLALPSGGLIAFIESRVAIKR